MDTSIAEKTKHYILVGQKVLISQEVGGGWTQVGVGKRGGGGPATAAHVFPLTNVSFSSGGMGEAAVEGSAGAPTGFGSVGGAGGWGSGWSRGGG